MINRQHIFLILIVCLLLMPLAACGTSTSTVESAVPAATPVRDEPITLFLWYAWPSPEQQTFAALIDQYNRSQPLIQVIPQAKPLVSLGNEIRAATLAGGGPHLLLLQSHTLGMFVQDGLLLPLDQLVPAGDRDNLFPATLAGAHVRNATGENVLYGLPITYDTLALYYNKANIDIPPSNTDTLLSNARGLTDATTAPPVWGLAYNLSLDKTIGYMYAFGGRIFNEDGQLVLGNEGRIGVERWLEWLLTLRRDTQLLAVNDSIVVDSALKSRQALMTIDWAHALPSYAALWGDNLGVAPLPRLSATNRDPQSYVQSDVLSINARVNDQDEQQAALNVMRYLLDNESQQALLEAGKQPARRNLRLDSVEQYNQAARAFRIEVTHGQSMPNDQRVATVVWDELERMQMKVLRGLETPTDAVTAADEALRQRLEGASPTVNGTDQ